MKKCLTFIAMVLIAGVCNAQNGAKCSDKDFNKLVGDWQGSLTYLDYSSGESYTMPANVKIDRIKKTNKFIFSNIYPNEPKANSKDTITISANGKYINKKQVKSTQKLSNGSVEIIAEEMGTDGNDNKKATFRYTYILGKTIFLIKKEVQFVGKSEWIKRHEYSYKR